MNVQPGFTHTHTFWLARGSRQKWDAICYQMDSQWKQTGLTAPRSLVSSRRETFRFGGKTLKTTFFPFADSPIHYTTYCYVWIPLLHAPQTKPDNWIGSCRVSQKWRNSILDQGKWWTPRRAGWIPAPQFYVGLKTQSTSLIYSLKPWANFHLCYVTCYEIAIFAR